MHNISKAQYLVHNKHSINVGHSYNNLGTLSNPRLPGPTHHPLSQIRHFIHTFITTPNPEVVLTLLEVMGYKKSA